MSEKPQLTMRYLADLIERLEERIAILEQKNDNKKTTKKIVIIEDQPIIIKKAK
jgi:sensor domain CHASE-containing protein